MSSISDPLDLHSESDFMFRMNSLAVAVRQMFSIEEKRIIVHLITHQLTRKHKENKKSEVSISLIQKIKKKQ
jgi:hypothetical protein